MSQGKILVIRGGAIGDFILTLPAIRALRETFSEARLEILGYPRIAGLAKDSGLVDDVKSIEARPMAGFFAKNGVLDESLGEYFASFAVIISYLYDPDMIFRTNVLKVSDAQIIQGDHRPNDAGSEHATDFFLKPLEKLAIFEADATPQLGISDSENSDGLESFPNGKWLAIHPGSGSEQKNWSLERWIELVEDVIQNSSTNLVLVGGEADHTRLSTIQELGPRERLVCAINVDLYPLARMMRRCSGFLGHDSGITHLAAAIGLRCLVLWGPTNHDVWGPKGNYIHTMEGTSGLESIEVHQVKANLVGLLAD